MKPHQIIKRPLLTEKGTNVKDADNPEEVRPKVLFEVHFNANKYQIRQAVETLFSVRVADVNTSIVPGKMKRVGRNTGRRPQWKKAIVTLVKGSKIEFFEGA